MHTGACCVDKVASDRHGQAADDRAHRQTLQNRPWMAPNIAGDQQRERKADDEPCQVVGAFAEQVCYDDRDNRGGESSNIPLVAAASV